VVGIEAFEQDARGRGSRLAELRVVLEQVSQLRYRLGWLIEFGDEPVERLV
jgi:hypothetical protein